MLRESVLYRLSQFFWPVNFFVSAIDHMHHLKFAVISQFFNKFLRARAGCSAISVCQVNDFPTNLLGYLLLR